MVPGIKDRSASAARPVPDAQINQMLIDNPRAILGREKLPS
jgi:hypothetical protein